ncbi:hypothetical protein BG20_I0173 [Candidatus Nitrosarchaeum limnium BG20]|uniref:Uncharacterized protein n=1 Tax=Candidatus Nitrosarchaeum limnium BG20 TaxID=859192 RepID=S2E3G1_9ARCH|nr:hypothetical protein BG20_I0173 [Candidatus Nitrosarchaeum limnium BG20]
MSDLQKSLKLKHDEIISETRHFEDLDCLDKTIRDEGN